MSPDEFWEHTQEEFEARYDVWQEQQQDWDLRFGLVASTIWNFKVKPGYERKPGDFFGYVSPEDEEEMSIEETCAFAKALADAHNKRLNVS